MQDAINYMEDHLRDDLDLQAISHHINYSLSQFYRIFKGMTGMTPMAYVRKRRLSEACRDLITRKSTILQVAVDYGYESHEAFTRRFKAEYRVLPSHLSQAPSIHLFEKINLLSYMKGVCTMKVNIVQEHPKTIIACKKKITGPVTDKFKSMKATRLAFEDHQLKAKDKLYIATYDFDIEDIHSPHEDMEYTYYYGKIHQDEDLGGDLVIKHIPGGKYAVFTYHKDQKLLNGQVIDRPAYDYINGVWLPESGYQLADQEDYEVHEQGKQVITYYISLED